MKIFALKDDCTKKPALKKYLHKKEVAAEKKLYNKRICTEKEFAKKKNLHQKIIALISIIGAKKIFTL